MFLTVIKKKLKKNVLNYYSSLAIKPSFLLSASWFLFIDRIQGLISKFVNTQKGDRLLVWPYTGVPDNVLCSFLSSLLSAPYTLPLPPSTRPNRFRPSPHPVRYCGRRNAEKIKVTSAENRELLKFSQ